MKKIIGVCATMVNAELCRSFLGVFRKAAGNRGYSTVVFHSIFDFYDSEESAGAKRIFEMIPYDCLSALIIMRDCIYDEKLLEMIVSSASGSGIPVIMVRGSDSRCVSIVGDHEPAYEELLRSVIEKNHITDTYFLAGRRTADPDSQQRLAVYRKVLEGCGIEYDERRLGYGEYRDIPAEEAARALIADGKKPPRAIFCANDIMAFTVMRVLKSEGYSIPQDVIVTGFDGLEHSVYCVPSLSTCREDINALAELAAETAEKLSEGIEVPSLRKYPYKAVISESSEENITERSERRETGIFSRMRVDEEDETAANRWIDTVLAYPCMDNLRNCLSRTVNGGNSVCLRTDAFFGESNNKNIPENYMLMREKHSEKLCRADEVMGELVSGISPEKTLYISMITKDEYIYGIACSETNNIDCESGKINRFVRTLDRALLAAICGERQLKLAEEEYGTKYIDALTGLKNNDGAVKWYEEQASSEASVSAQMTLGVYTLVNYQEILDRLGTKIIEECICYMGKSLRLANPDNAVLARISHDSIAVMTVHEPGYFGYAVDKAISLFYGFLDIHNKKAGETAGMDVSCGYTDIIPPWKGKLTDHLNAAISTLYKNRLIFNKSLPEGHDINDGASALRIQSKLLRLLNENLFIFNFQPIVDAKNGEIIAYEALMRTEKEIGMSPLDVLSAAGMYNKQNQVEFACFRNILRSISEKRDKFNGRKVFINTIPGFFLIKEQCNLLTSEFGDVLSDVVIEITESETISGEELEAIKSFGGNFSHIKVAVDDYGTGHSNVVNLIEYKPEIVKIDRYLVTNIQSDKNKQMFVKNLIEFSKENNIKVLAEGVETKEELLTVIDFGADLIQGYYTGRPSAEIITEIDPEIKKLMAKK